MLAVLGIHKNWLTKNGCTKVASHPQGKGRHPGDNRILLGLPVHRQPHSSFTARGYLKWVCIDSFEPTRFEATVPVLETFFCGGAVSTKQSEPPYFSRWSKTRDRRESFALLYLALLQRRVCACTRGGSWRTRPRLTCEMSCVG